MRLPDFINQIRRKFSETLNFARNPDQVVYRQGRRIALQRYEQMSLPGNNTKKAGISDPQPEPSIAVLHRTLPETSQRQTNLPPQSQSAVSTTLTQTPKIAFDYPEALRLQPGDVLTRGWIGRYIVGSCLQDQHWMRLYEGLQENSNEPVWIYEYGLSQTVFNERDTQSRRTAFKQLIDLNSWLGEGSDFRILKLRDVIVAPQQPCYLITQGLPEGQGLSQCLASRDQPFSPDQVREFLRQVLQSLKYLQAYQVHWPDGSLQAGLPHGHLNLDSLWIRFSETKTSRQGDAFFVYLSRLALWEHLFYAGEPPIQPIAQTNQALGTFADDLKGLGQMAFALLTGNTQLDPTNLQVWPNDPYTRSFYPYICRLIGHGPEEAFRNPDIAIAALPKRSPVAESVPPDLAESEPETTSSAHRAKRWPWLLAAMMLLGISIPLWQWLLRGRPHIEFAGPVCEASTGCVLNLGSFTSVTDSAASITYGFEPGSYWKESFFRSLRSPAVRSTSFLFLEESLERRTQALPSTLVRTARAPRDRIDLLNQIQQGQLQAGFIRGGQALPPGVSATTVAYDGIAIFVIYSDAQRDHNVLRLLEDHGRISLTELRALFTQQQQTIGSAQTPVQLYFPQGYVRSIEGEETVRLFRELVFDDSDDQAQFDAIHRQALQTVDNLENQPASIYAHMLNDFETQVDANNEVVNPVIGIGFDRISRMHGQCSVYPLTLTHNGRTYPVLVKDDGSSIDLSTDLCGDKGTYWVNSNIFEAPGRKPNEIDYPLGYSMSVAHPQQCTTSSANAECQIPGELLAQNLLSIEGQYLLSEVGLVPVEPIHRIRRFLWR